VALGKGGAFVGAHPMAGSERSGWEHGTPDLFEGRTCFVTPHKGADPRALRLVSRLWRDLGAKVVAVDPDTHDTIVAHISHLPQVLASALCSFLAGKPSSWRDFAGGGLRDTTRIAASNPRVWMPILRQNRRAVSAALQGLIRELDAFDAALSKSDSRKVSARLRRARNYRIGLRTP
jgi:prephenate dehydrogenase